MVSVSLSPGLECGVFELLLRRVVYYHMIRSPAVNILPFISIQNLGHFFRFGTRILPMKTLGYSFLSLS